MKSTVKKRNPLTSKKQSATTIKKANNLLNRGMTLHNQGQVDEASALYKQVLELTPQNGHALHLLGVTFIQHARFREAITYISQSIQIDSNNSLAHYNLGLAYQNTNNDKLALNSYEQAISINPNYTEALLNAGSLYMRLDKPNEAERQFRKALFVSPERLDTNNNLGLFLLERKEFFSAIDYIEKAISLDPSNAESHNNLGLIYQGIGDINNAIVAYNKALSLNSKYYTAINNLASAYDRNLEAERAINLYKKSSKINTHSAISNTCLGIYYWLSNDLQACRNHVSACEQYDKSHYTTKQWKFIDGYTSFLIKLLNEVPETKKVPVSFEDEHNILPIIGDSHCLTYTRGEIVISGQLKKVKPQLMIGCKAWHLAKKGNNEYKHQFLKHLESTRCHKEIFVTLGEIDCRSTEGILVAFKKEANKTNKPTAILSNKTALSALQKHVSRLVKDYCTFIQEACTEHNRVAYLFNVPAPKEGTAPEEELLELATLIQLYNDTLSEEVSKLENLRLIDIYEITNDRDGLSSGEYHIDQTHLSPKIISKISL